MKKTILALLAGVSMALLSSCGNGQGNAKLETAKDTASYYMGMSQTLPLHAQWEQIQYQIPGDSATKQQDFISGFRDALKKGGSKPAYAAGFSQGTQLAQMLDRWDEVTKNFPGEPLDKDRFMAGLWAGLEGVKDTTLTVESLNSYIQTYFENAKTAIAEKNKAEGAKFLAENKTKEGVVELPSGLQYRIDKLGTGDKPLAEDTVKVHYKGTKLDGTVFDSSYDRGTPADFPLTGVIKGFSEGLQQVPAGSKVTLWIPGELAYGERGAGQDIGPFEMLTFEMELLEVHHAKESKK